MCHHIEPIDYNELGEALSRWNTGSRAFAQRRPAPPGAYPGSKVAVAVPAYNKDLQAAVLTWGFDRPGPKAEKPSAPKRAETLFNTRLETAIEQARTGRGLWAKAIAGGRCLVPVRAFYEWDSRPVSPDPDAPAARRQECRFTVPGSGVFLLAGIYQGDRFSVVTTAPNHWVAPVHNRMPLVLGPGESRAWLNGEFEALANREAVELEAEPVRINGGSGA